MGNHLPPPKNKHVRPGAGNNEAKVSEKKIKQEKIECVYEYSFREILVCSIAALLLIVAQFLPVEGWMRLVAFLIPSLLAGAEIIRIAVVKLLGLDIVQEELLLIIATVAAFAIGEYAAASASLIIYRAGKLIEAAVLKKSRKAKTEFSDIRASVANVETNLGVTRMRPVEVQIGDIIIVNPGEIIPLDGIVVDGISAVDVWPITADKTSHAVAAGSKAVSGCVNITSPIKIQVSRSFAESTAVRMMELLEKPVGFKSRQENFAAHFSRFYPRIIALAALVIGILPPLFDGQWVQWIRKAVVLLLISSPAALAVSVPLSYIGGIRSAAHSGIVFKGMNFLENLSKAQIMVFVKTGIISEGKYSIVDVFPEGVSESALISAAAEAELYSDHPIAKMLKAAAGPREKAHTVRQVEELPGKGISSFVGKRQVYVGNAALLEEHGINYKVPSRAGAAIHVAVDESYWGHIIVSDKLRSGAFDALEALRHYGVNSMVMLTGDVRAVARPIASSLNFDMVKTELLPEGKVSAVEYLLATKADNATLVFVGDGDKDAQCLSRADVGIACGALYSDDGIENADVIIMSQDIRRLPLAMKIARLTVNTANRNIAAVLLVKLVILCFALLGIMPILAAAIADFAALAFAYINTGSIFRFINKEDESEKHD